MIDHAEKLRAGVRAKVGAPVYSLLPGYDAQADGLPV